MNHAKALFFLFFFLKGDINFFKLSVMCEKTKYYHMKLFCKGVQGIVNAYKKQIRYKGRRKKNISDTIL